MTELMRYVTVNKLLRYSTFGHQITRGLIRIGLYAVLSFSSLSVVDITDCVLLRPERPQSKPKPLRYLVRSWFEAGRAPVADLLARASSLVLVRCYSKLDDKPNFSSLQVCDQLRTSFEPDSVMEFGFESVCDQLRTS